MAIDAIRKNAMIADTEEMKKIESESGLTSRQLMQKAGESCAERLQQLIPEGSSVLILLGKGNNGGDGSIIASILKEYYQCRVYLCEGKPATPEAMDAYNLLPVHMHVSEKGFGKAFLQADVIIDCIYGFGYHGSLNEKDRKLFQKVNASGKAVYSIDINSGCQADDGACDRDAIHSDLTLALDCYKPFHMLRRQHQKFNHAELINLGLPHPDHTKYYEMNEKLFFENFPEKPENAYKGIYGKTLFISGCWGMAGAACLNLTGAKAVGAPYINMALPEEIYTTVASHFITPVFHPFGHESWHEVLEPLINDARAIGFGSGAVYMTHKEGILDLLMQNAHVPVVLDAEALRLLTHNTWILRFAHAPVILTPHIGEFASFSGYPMEEIRSNPVGTASKFAKENHVIMVLKGPDTVVAGAHGDIYINQSGCQALAQAGSGDVLTGMMAAILSMTSDVFMAVCMAVWLHGYLSQLGSESHSMQNFSLLDYPQLMDQLFKKHGY